ncbi:U32 family peptidase [Amphritea balenae]|uniref:U32 family peptidase n=1 Tax=Amphritea balenae TaxID=452629 RepID=UPI003571554A
MHRSYCRNAQTAMFYQERRATPLILSREMTLKEISQLRGSKPVNRPAICLDNYNYQRTDSLSMSENEIAELSHNHPCH